MLGVIKTFEFPSEQYNEDVRRIAASTIEKYGLQEWKRVVLTNEIHGHLGIYSTLGAKMAVRAKELLNAGEHDDITVISFAGLKPPVSCFNDGLQVGCGATLGHGLITVSEEEEKRAEAEFRLEDRSLRLKLKDEYRSRIQDDIRKGVEMYGHQPQYWQYVRSLAIKYWSEWDRGEIFETL